MAKHEIVIGVPFRQDTRVDRCTCSSCGKTNPPWGHVNIFDEAELIGLFPGTRVISKSFVGTTRSSTSALAAFLMDLGGNPWGAYDQDEPCIYCGAKLTAPGNRPLWQRACSSIAIRLDRLHENFVRPHANWIHVVLAK